MADYSRTRDSVSFGPDMLRAPENTRKAAQDFQGTQIKSIQNAVSVAKASDDMGSKRGYVPND